MTALERDHYAVGWNDTEYGLNNWHDSDTWENVIQWAIHMRKLAEECKAQTCGAHNFAYFNGIIDCVKQFFNTGMVERKARESFEALNR